MTDQGVAFPELEELRDGRVRLLFAGFEDLQVHLLPPARQDLYQAEYRHRPPAGGHKCTRALPACDCSIAFEQIQGAPDHHPGNLELFFELSLRRELRALSPGRRFNCLE